LAFLAGLIAAFPAQFFPFPSLLTDEAAFEGREVAQLSLSGFEIRKALGQFRPPLPAFLPTEGFTHAELLAGKRGSHTRPLASESRPFRAETALEVPFANSLRTRQPLFPEPLTSEPSQLTGSAQIKISASARKVRLKASFTHILTAPCFFQSRNITTQAAESAATFQTQPCSAVPFIQFRAPFASGFAPESLLPPKPATNQILYGAGAFQPQPGAPVPFIQFRAPFTARLAPESLLESRFR
jgi:hypothetical protein